MTRALTIIGVASILGACARDDGAVFATGVFESTEIIVSSEATGKLVSLSVTEGQDLDAGAAVGRIDCRQLELQREQALTNMNGLKTKVTDVSTQTAAVAQQLAAAERERKRIEQLFADSAATQKQIDDANAQVAIYRSRQEATSQSLTTGNRELKDQRAVMQVQLDELDDQIGRCELKAPAAGTVLVKYAQQGEFMSPGKPVFKMADMKNMILRAYVTTDQLSQLKLDQAVKVQADFGADGNRLYDGHLVWVASKAEFTPKTIQTRDERANQVYPVKIAVANDGYLKLGMYGAIPLGTEHVGHSGAPAQ